MDLTASLDFCRAVSEKHDRLGRYTLESGMDVLGYSATETKVFDLYTDHLLSLGWRVFTDVAGNRTAFKEPKNPALKTVMIGSHLDSVVRGGQWDGRQGVLVGMALAHQLEQEKKGLEHGLAVQIFRTEESARFGKALIGSAFATGRASMDDLGLSSITEGDSLKLGQAMEEQGADLKTLKRAVEKGSALIPLSDIAFFAETHIEQAPGLRRAGKDIGVGTGIRGNMRADVRFLGEAGHSGAMPHGLRHDAQEAMAKLQVGFYAFGDMIREAEGRDIERTVTLHEIRNPGPTTVPDDVYARLEIRSTDLEVLQRGKEFVEQGALILAGKHGLEIPGGVRAPISMPVPDLAPAVIAHLEQSTAGLGLSSMRLPLGAGHDAMNMHLAGVPTAMFVTPHGANCDGSHHPLEDMVTEAGADPFSASGPFANAVSANYRAVTNYHAPRTDHERSFIDRMQECGATEVTQNFSMV